MKNYRIKIKLKSPIITPFMADTIFGHIAWALRYLYGIDFLNEFLIEYYDTPPLVISNGFPEGFISKPCTNPLSVVEKDNLIKKYYKGKEINGHTALKNMKNFTLINLEVFNKLIDNYSEYNLYELVFEEK